MVKRIISITALCLFCVFLLIVGYNQRVPVNKIGYENGYLASKPTAYAPITTTNGAPICQPEEVITGDYEPGE